MAAIYSTSFWDALLSSATNYTQAFGTSGNTVVIRDMEMINDSAITPALKGFIVYNNATGNDYWEVRAPRARSRENLNWRGRLVIPGGTVIKITTFDPTWYVKISGYQLTP